MSSNNDQMINKLILLQCKNLSKYVIQIEINGICYQDNDKEKEKHLNY